MNVPIVICSRSDSNHLQVLLKSIECYVRGAEVYVCCNDKINSLVIKEIIPNDVDTAGAAFDKILRYVFQNYNKAILINDDVVLGPDSYKLLTEDWQKLKKQNVGILSARSDHCLPSHSIRFSQPNDTMNGLRWNSENEIKQVSSVAPVFCIIDRDAYLKSGGFPPINWYSDNILCQEMQKNDYTVFVSRSYVHHLGEQTQGKNHDQLYQDSIKRLKGTRWDDYIKTFNPPGVHPIQSNNKNIRRVMVGTPCYDGRVDVVYFHSLLNSIKLCSKHNIDVMPIHISYEAIISVARNDIFKLAHNFDLDDLVFIDSDVEWSPEGFLKLLQHPVDFVGCALVKKGNPESYTVKSLEWPIPRDPKTNLLLVDGVGTGFLRISKQAIKKIWENSLPYDHDKENNNRNVFETKIIDGKFTGEDICFCTKWLELGEKIYLDDNFTCSHVGIHKWTGDFKSWLSRIKPT